MLETRRRAWLALPLLVAVLAGLWWRVGTRADDGYRAVLAVLAGDGLTLNEAGYRHGWLHSTVATDLAWRRGAGVRLHLQSEIAHLAPPDAAAVRTRVGWLAADGGVRWLPLEIDTRVRLDGGLQARMRPAAGWRRLRLEGLDGELLRAGAGGAVTARLSLAALHLETASGTLDGTLEVAWHSSGGGGGGGWAEALEATLRLAAPPPLVQAALGLYSEAPRPLLEWLLRQDLLVREEGRLGMRLRLVAGLLTVNGKTVPLSGAR